MGTDIIRLIFLDYGRFHGNITSNLSRYIFIFDLNSLIFILFFGEFFFFFATSWK